MQRNNAKINERLISKKHNITNSGFSYYPAGTVRKHSFVMRTDNSLIEIYKPKKELGRGANGVVRLFQSTENHDHTLAVKSPLPVIECEEYPVDQQEMDGLVRAINREVEYFSKFYPHMSPCLADHFINAANQYDNRVLMPYLPGKTLSHFVKTEIHSAAAYALLMLKVSQEVARLHEMGLYHGDLRSGNIMIQQSDQMEFGLPSYTVHLIDFDHGGEIGKDRFADIEGDIAFFEIFYAGINHQTDIMSLQLWFNICKVNLFFNCPEAKTLLPEHFPALKKFSASIDTDDEWQVPEPEKLKQYIDDLTENLLAWQRTSQLRTEKQNGYAANLGLFPIKKKSVSHEELIEQQWESTRIVL